MTQDKTDLTPKERIAVAYLYHVRGVEQIDLTVAYPGVNQGRISEACTALMMAAQDPKQARKDMEEGARRREEGAAERKARRTRKPRRQAEPRLEVQPEAETDQPTLKLVVGG